MPHPRLPSEWNAVITPSARNDVLWVTNNAAPYRRPVWRSLAQRVELEILLLASDRGLAREHRRGSDWRGSTLSTEIGYSHRFAKTLRVGRGERRYFVLRESARALARGRSSIVFGGWESPAYWQLLFAAPRVVRRVGFYESTSWSNRFTAGPIARARAHFYRAMDFVVVPGVAAGDAVRAMGVPEGKILTGFNAVDVDAFAEAAKSTPDRTAASGHRYVYVGQLIKRKNIERLIRAFGRVRNFNDSLTIVGDGEMRSMLENLSHSLALDGFVRFEGHKPYAALPGTLSQADTLVLPSEEEVWGLVVNEALAAGCQVVVSNRAGVAPSVAGMAGVYVVGVDLPGLEKGIIAAREQYVGRVRTPEITQFTPEKFADVFHEALTAP